MGNNFLVILTGSGSLASNGYFDSDSIIVEVILYADPTYSASTYDLTVTSYFDTAKTITDVKTQSGIATTADLSGISQVTLYLSLFVRNGTFSLRKHAYSNILNILQPKTREKFQIKFFYIFHISSQNIDCGYSLEPPRRGSFNKCPQSMLFSKIRKMYTPVNPSFTI